MPAKLVDMCQGGVGLVIRDSLNEGDKIVVELTPPTGRHPITHMAEVRWSQPLVDGLYRIGCSFEHRLDFAEMQNYV